MSDIGEAVLGQWIKDILTDGPRQFSEEERSALRADLDPTVDLSVFTAGTVVSLTGKAYTHDNADNNSLKAQAYFVLNALGESRTKELVLVALEDAVIYRPGCKIYKKSDRDLGRPEPTIPEIRQYFDTLWRRWTTTGFVFSPSTEEKKIFWADILIQRVEAIFSVTYTMLRLLSYESETEAHVYQEGEYFNHNFMVRLTKGWARALKSLGEELPNHLSTKDEGMIRHLHPAVLAGSIWEGLSK